MLAVLHAGQAGVMAEVAGDVVSTRVAEEKAQSDLGMLLPPQKLDPGCFSQ